MLLHYRVIIQWEIYIHTRSLLSLPPPLFPVPFFPRIVPYEMSRLFIWQIGDLPEDIGDQKNGLNLETHICRDNTREGCFRTSHLCDAACSKSADRLNKFELFLPGFLFVLRHILYDTIWTHKSYKLHLYVWTLSEAKTTQAQFLAN